MATTKQRQSDKPVSAGSPRRIGKATAAGSAAQETAPVEAVSDSPIEEESHADLSNLSIDELRKLLSASEPASAEPVKVVAPQLGLIRFLPWVAMLVLGYFVLSKEFDKKPTPDKPDVVVDDTLAALAKKAFPNSSDRAAFGAVIESVANLVEMDGTDKKAIETRSQASETLSKITARAFLLTRKPKDPDKESLASLLGSAFDSEEEFPQSEGALSPEDRAKAVKQYRLISSACK